MSGTPRPMTALDLRSLIEALEQLPLEGLEGSVQLYTAGLEFKGEYEERDDFIVAAYDRVLEQWVVFVETYEAVDYE